MIKELSRNNTLIEKSFNLNTIQKSILLMNGLYPDSNAFNRLIAFKIVGDLNLNLLDRALNNTIESDPHFKKFFKEELSNGYLKEHISIKLNYWNLLGAPDVNTRMGEIIETEKSHKINLSEAPLLRVTLIRMDNIEYLIIFNYHIISLDDNAARYLLKEISANYNELYGGENIEANISMENELDIYPILETTILNEWKDRFKNRKLNLELFTDMLRPAVQTLEGSSVKASFSEPLNSRLVKITSTHKYGLKELFLSAYSLLLNKYSNDTSLIIGFPTDIRIDANQYGNYRNILPLIVDLDKGATVSEYISYISEEIDYVEKRKSIFYEDIVNAIKPTRNKAYNPVYQVTYDYIDTPITLELDNTEIVEYTVSSKGSRYDLSLRITNNKNKFSVELEYSTKLFNKSTIKRILQHYSVLLEEIIDNPNTPIKQLNMLSRSERDRIIYNFNDTAANNNLMLVNRMFERTAKDCSNKIAVTFGQDSITYLELNKNANRLANYLLQQGVKSGDLIGVCLDRRMEIPEIFLGILKANAAYVPLDPEFPEDRIEYMVEHSKINLIITSRDISENLSKIRAVKNLFYQDEKENLKNYSSENPTNDLSIEAIAYVLYTSGSTGKPKGVQISHKALSNFLYSMAKVPGITSNDKLLAVTTFSFDIAELELFLPLTSGAEVVIAAKSHTLDAQELIEDIKRHNITYMQATPATWKMMLDLGWRNPTKIKILCGGEALPKQLSNKLIDLGGELWNMYGPTETTIWSSVKQITEKDRNILIGKPIDNTQFYILDEELNPTGIGIPGELHIGGLGLSNGYLYRDDLTEERFINNPFITGTKIYKTGDIAKYNMDGEVECLGRTDLQVKIRGYRIEIEEIERALIKIEEIKEAFVVPKDDRSGSKILAAYLIRNSDVEIEDIKRNLHINLPYYMVPSVYVFVDEYPLTPNKKIDRKALIASEIELVKDESQHEEAKTPTEIQLKSIWEQLLNVKHIGITDNFFDLGGHSLLAARMFSRIKDVMGVNIPLALLFQAPTIKELAKHINSTDNQWGLVVPIQTNGSNPPIFLIHGGEGNVLIYKEVSDYLGDNQPVYGVQSQGLDGNYDFNPDFVVLAKKYVTEIKKIQPTGPYYLGGYCLGGTIAYEMAKQLREKGEDIGLLIMFESYNERSIIMKDSFAFAILRKLQNVYYHLHNYITIDSDSRKKFLARKVETSKFRWKVRYNNLLAKVTRNEELLKAFPHLIIQKKNDRAEKEYEASKTDNEILLFKPKREFIGLSDPTYGWGDFAKVNVVEIDVSPRGMMVEPYVKDVAFNLKRQIAKKLNNNMV